MNPAAALTTTLGLRAETRRYDFLTVTGGLERIVDGFPRGAISEIAGPDSCGRTAVAHSVVAAATSNLEICAYVDASDSFDPCSAAAAGVALEQIVWARCSGNVEHAMKVADNLLHAGGFGVVVLDVCDVPQRAARRIPLSYWYRFRLAVENTPSILLVVEREPLAKSCAALVLDLKRHKATWTGGAGFKLLRGIDVEAARRKPVTSRAAACNLRLAV